jgi:hypothetical protein
VTAAKRHWRRTAPPWALSPARTLPEGRARRRRAAPRRRPSLCPRVGSRRRRQLGSTSFPARGRTALLKALCLVLVISDNT